MLLSYVRTYHDYTEHDLLMIFLTIKAHLFHNVETEDVFKFIIDYYERLHKLGIMQQHSVEFMT